MKHILMTLLLLTFLLASCSSGVGTCTLEAKVCPDGSTVGRSGLNCEFEKCPEMQRQECGERAEYCYELYKPVCGFNADEESIKTFGNDCFACQDEDVAYYFEGECQENQE